MFLVWGFVLCILAKVLIQYPTANPCQLSVMQLPAESGGHLLHWQSEDMPCRIQFTELTTTMEQCPSWDAKSHSNSKEISRLLWNLKVHYCVHKKSPPLVPIMSQMLYMLPTCFIKIHSNMSRSSKWSLSFMFSDFNLLKQI